MKPIFSILIPSVPSRISRAIALFQKLQNQAAKVAPDAVEILMLTDNKKRSVGLKRQALLSAARGEYVAFCDDDDEPAEDYVELILEAAARGKDVVTFRQLCVIEAVPSWVDFSILHPGHEPVRAGETAKRKPWHVCAWRREIAQQCVFPDLMYGEDAAWVAQANRLARTESRIDAVLHTYQWSAATSEAPAE